MFRRHRRRRDPSRIDPDLPITPMLDMSFQLLAFFVMTFNPVAPEGHLDLALPVVQGGAAAPPPASLDVEPEELIVKVDATPDGDLKEITLTGKSEGTPLVLPNRAALVEELKKRLKEKGVAPKVKLEIADKLVYELVVYMIDEIHRAGYRQIAPTLLDSKKK